MSALVAECDRDRVRRALRLRLEQLVDARVARELRWPCRSTRSSSWRRSSSPSSGSSRQRARRLRDDRLRAARAKCPRHPLDASPRRTDRSAYSSTPASPSPRSLHRQRQIELRRRRSRAADRRASAPPARGASTGAFCRTNITWNSGVRLRIARRAQLLHQPLERHVLVRVARRAASFARAPAARERSGRRSSCARSASVLTKKPISASSLAARAVGDRRADRDVVLPACSGAAAPRTPRAAS